MSNIENLTIMFTDIVGFSNMVSTLPRRTSEHILKKHNRILQKVIERFGGNKIKSVGDSFLVTFRSPTDAVLCAMAIHDALWQANEGVDEDRQITIRIALNTGEVRLTANDVFGEAVNIAARLEKETPAGAIYLTESVYLSMNKSEVELLEIGAKQFKGIPDIITIYQASNRVGKNIGEDLVNFPYGGAHLYLKPAGRPFYIASRVFIGLCSVIITAFFTWWATINYMPSPTSIELDKISVEYKPSAEVTEADTISYLPDITDEIKLAAEPLVKEKNYLSLKKLVDDYLPENPDNSYLSLLQGHINFYYKKYEEALLYYESALSSDEYIANDALLAVNLVKLLDYQRIKTNQLIGKYLSEPILNALAKRTGKEGLRARYDAFYLLKDSGNIERVDKVGLNIWDLKELEKCALKRVAVKELKRLEDPRALPALKEIIDVGFWQRFKYSCLISDAEEAVDLIEAKIEGKKKES